MLLADQYLRLDSQSKIIANQKGQAKAHPFFKY
jgi:hypothetical protein